MCPVRFESFSASLHQCEKLPVALDFGLRRFGFLGLKSAWLVLILEQGLRCVLASHEGLEGYWHATQRVDAGCIFHEGIDISWS